MVHRVRDDMCFVATSQTSMKAFKRQETDAAQIGQKDRQQDEATRRLQAVH